MFNRHDSNQPGLRQERNDQGEVVNQHHYPDLLMDLAQPLPDPTPSPAVSVDNEPRGCVDSGDTFPTMSRGPWQGNRVGAQLHPAPETIATGWSQQPFVLVDGSFSQPQFPPAVDPNSEPTFPHTTHGPSPSRQEGYLDPSFSGGMRSDPWSPETAWSNTQLASQVGYERACSGGSLPSVRTPSQDQSSISEALSQYTPISSQTTGTGGMGNSMMTLVVNHANERGVSDGIETGYHSWESGHGLDSPNDPQNISNSHMLDRYVNTAGLNSFRSTQQMYPENQNPRLLVPGNSNTHGAPISRSSSTISRVPLILCCEFCGNEYTGEYRKGNLARHRRQKHGIEEQVYPCEEPQCSKEFKRQDARLKHYRAHHPHLALGPFVSRTN